MKLPIPARWGDKIIVECEVSKPKAGIIAETKSAVDRNDYYTALKIFCGGVVDSFIDTDGGIVTDKQQIRAIMNAMPFRSAEYIAIQSIIAIDGDDGVEGIYVCPRCGEKVISGYEEVDGVVMDTRDFISGLEVRYADANNGIHIRLEEPLKVNKGNEEIVVDSLVLQHPTIEHCIKAGNRVGYSNIMKLQLAILAEAMQELNGTKISGIMREVSYKVVENISTKELYEIVSELGSYGLQTRVKKVCRACGKEFMCTVNTSNFFDFTTRL